MTIELDSVAANAPDNAEGATVRTTRYAINAAHASGNITGEQHAEARGCRRRERHDQRRSDEFSH